jgi:hypothetical protein
MEELYRELWILLYDSGADLRHYVRDVYDESRGCAADPVRRYEVFCGMCAEVSYIRGCRLPESIHVALVLGPVNDGVRRYLDFCRGLKESVGMVG